MLLKFKLECFDYFQVQVVFQHLVISNQERYFPQADHFLPERWLKTSRTCNATTGCPVKKPTTAIHPFVSLPFGYGRRMCLGRRFADLEIQTLITKVRDQNQFFSGVKITSHVVATTAITNYRQLHLQRTL
jgi:cytochrome P450